MARGKFADHFSFNAFYFGLPDTVGVDVTSEDDKGLFVLRPDPVIQHSGFNTPHASLH